MLHCASLIILARKQLGYEAEDVACVDSIMRSRELYIHIYICICLGKQKENQQFIVETNDRVSCKLGTHKQCALNVSAAWLTIAVHPPFITPADTYYCRHGDPIQTAFTFYAQSKVRFVCLSEETSVVGMKYLMSFSRLNSYSITAQLLLLLLPPPPPLTTSAATTTYYYYYYSCCFYYYYCC